MRNRRLSFRVRMNAFRVLEALSVAASGAPIPPARNPVPPLDHRRGSIWVFVSTIGELNAIEPFLRRLIQERGNPPVTLITDRRIYRESFQAKYPHSFVYEIDGTTPDARQLARMAPPLLFVIAEIPCLLHDAPCRLPFALLHEARQRFAAVALVNGWAYGYQEPRSRLDALERRWFNADYVSGIDLFCVQTDNLRADLIQSGVTPGKIHVTGNMKFDALDSANWTPSGAKSEDLLRGIIESGRPAVVCGCVTDLHEQVLMLDGFELARSAAPAALLVIVPRHPEVRDRLDRLEEELSRRCLSYAFRSRIGKARLPENVTCLVVDTMGELRDFYAASTICYVGQNHNVLEPLAFGKPVTVLPGWEATYPSFPVYQMMKQAGVIEEVMDGLQLGAAWAGQLGDSRAYRARRDAIHKAVAGSRGAADRCLRLVAELPWRSDGAVSPGTRSA